MQHFIQQIPTLIKTIFQNYYISILYFLFLLTVAFYPIGFSFSSTIFVNIFSIIILLSIIGRIKSMIIKIILNVIIIFYLSLSTFFSFVYSDWIWTEAVMAILNTNLKEAIGMSTQFFIPALIIITINTTFVIFSEREFKKRRNIPIPILCILLVLNLSYITYKCNKLAKLYSLSITTSPYSTTLFLTVTSPILYSNIVTTYTAIKEIQNLEKQRENIHLRTFPKGLSIKSDSTNNVERIYLIIGESSAKSHYSLYGYNVSTTPFLDSLKRIECQNLSYHNAISPASSTAASLFRSLSFAGIHFSSKDLSDMAILKIASEKQYKTYWISNQPPIGLHESVFSAIYLEADSLEFTQRKNPESSPKDTELIDIVNKYYNPMSKQFCIIHLNGSHIPYTNKYDDIDKKMISQSNYNTRIDKEILNYDRSIHQTDRLLKGLYDIINKDKNTILIYISDHGEIPGLGHGHMQKYKGQYEVPFIVFNFSQFNIETKLNKYKNVNDINFNNVNLPYILAEAMGYEVESTKTRFALENSPLIYLPDGTTVKYSDIVK